MRLIKGVEGRRLRHQLNMLNIVMLAGVVWVRVPEGTNGSDARSCDGSHPQPVVVRKSPPLLITTTCPESYILPLHAVALV